MLLVRVAIFCSCIISSPPSTLLYHFLFETSREQDIGGPATGEDSEAYVLDLEDFADLDDNFSSQILSLIITPCATNVELAVTVSDAVGSPTSVTCGQQGETCDASGKCRRVV